MNIVIPLAYDDIEKVAVLHKECLPDTHASKIGKRYLIRLYRVLLGHENSHILFAAKEKERIVGVITVSYDLRKTQRDMMESAVFGGIAVVLEALIRRKVSLRTLINQMKFEQAIISRFPSPYVSILTLFVDTSHRRKGIGKKLVRAVEEVTKEKGISEIFVDTKLRNTKAQAFYIALGFIKRAVIGDSMILSKV